LSRQAAGKARKAVLIGFMMFCSITLVFGSMTAVVYAGVAGVLYVDGIAVVDQFDVYPGTTHSIHVCNLPSYMGDSGSVSIKVSDTDLWITVSVSGECTVPFDWTVPDAPYCTTYVVKYKDPDGTPPGAFNAQGTIGNTGHLHVVPELPLGTIGAIGAAIVSLVIFSRKKHIPLMK